MPLAWKRGALSLALAAWATGSAQAAPVDEFTRQCGKLRGAVQVQTASAAGYRIDHSRSLLDLTTMSSKVAPRRFVLGLTWTEAKVELGTEFRILQDRAGRRECVAPRLRLTLRQEPIVVYLAREFAAGSCPYAAVREHEMRHLNAYQAHFATVEAQVRSRLRQRFEVAAQAAPLGQGQAKLEQEIEAVWLPAIKAELQKAEAQQAAIDSPQEYARLSKVCQGEVQSILQSVGTARR
jgi:hypothetical protein